MTRDKTITTEELSTLWLKRYFVLSAVSIFIIYIIELGGVFVSIFTIGVLFFVIKILEFIHQTVLVHRGLLVVSQDTESTNFMNVQTNNSHSTDDVVLEKIGKGLKKTWIFISVSALTFSLVSLSIYLSILLVNFMD